MAVEAAAAAVDVPDPVTELDDEDIKDGINEDVAEDTDATTADDDDEIADADADDDDNETEDDEIGSLSKCDANE